jgi:hypothetical protein
MYMVLAEPRHAGTSGFTTPANADDAAAATANATTTDPFFMAFPQPPVVWRTTRQPPLGSPHSDPKAEGVAETREIRLRRQNDKE